MNLNKPAMLYWGKVPEKKLDGVMTIFHPSLTKQEYAAIHLCVPMSGNAELDAMIRRAQRERLAGQIMIGKDILRGDSEKFPSAYNNYLAADCYKAADAVIAAGEGNHE